MTLAPARAGALVRAGALACAGALAIGGCGASNTAGPRAAPASGESDPHASEPFSHQQKLVAQGANLIVADGCSVCHLIGGSGRLGPSFATFAGHRVRLAGGRRVLVDERFLREGLLHPRRAEIAGYDPAPMIRALAPLRLAAHPAQLAGLAAFIEEVGPEPG